jgi:protein SCO1/2
MVAGLALISCDRSETLPSFGKVPAFSLRDQADSPATQQLFAGKVAVVDFIFTSCPDICPMLTQQMAELRRRLPQDPGLAFVSFSVDPETDTPARLREFAERHKALQPNWWFLTGDIAEVKKVVVSGFKQAMEAVPATPERPANVLHGTHFVLVDRQGEIRGYYRSEAEGVEPLTAAVKQLLADGGKP